MGEYGSELLESLLPQLQSALRTHSANAATDARARNAEAVLDQLYYAAFLVDESCHLLYMNSSAAMLMQRHDGLSLSQDGIAIWDATSRERVRALIESAVASGRVALRSPSRATTISRPSGKAAYQIQVKPLRVSDGLGNEQARALALVNDPESSYVFSDAVLRSLYGFPGRRARSSRD